jgi:hypothetical protein
MTGPTTPSASSGYEYYPVFGDGFFDLTVFVHNLHTISSLLQLFFIFKLCNISACI